jgi:hypothetical protein
VETQSEDPGLCRATVSFAGSRHEELHLTTFALDTNDYLQPTVEDVLWTESSPDEGIEGVAGQNNMVLLVLILLERYQCYKYILLRVVREGFNVYRRIGLMRAKAVLDFGTSPPLKTFIVRRGSVNFAMQTRVHYREGQEHCTDEAIVPPSASP